MINISRKAISVLFFILAARCRATAQTSVPAGDVQIWPDVQISVKLRPKIALYLFGTLREGRNLSAVTNEQWAAGFTFTLNQFLYVRPSYRYSASQIVRERHTQEHRFILELNTRLPLPAKFALVNRQQAEYRNLNGRSIGRYRARLQLEHPFTAGDYTFTPYTSYEQFYEGAYHSWSRSRAMIGTRWPVQQHLTLDTYYLKQNDARSRPGYLHAIGVVFRFDY